MFHVSFLNLPRSLFVVMMRSFAASILVLNGSTSILAFTSTRSNLVKKIIPISVKKAYVSMVTDSLLTAEKETKPFDDQQFYTEVNQDSTSCVFEDGGVSEEQCKALQLSSIMKAIPEKAFEKNLFKSLAFMVFDYAMWGGSFLAMLKLTQSSIWSTLEIWQKAAAFGSYWAVAGFFMWTIFVVGHDCGHTNFSKYKTLNDIIGHITHGSILVPYHPWQLSHRRHHMFHNHIEKDYSYAWFTPEKEAKPEHNMIRFFHGNFLAKLLLPFYGWPLYLFGSPDGSHFIPFKDQRLWSEGAPVERKKCLLSTAVVAAFASAFWVLSGQNLARFMLWYGAPYLIFGWWLVTVTYLQHHGPDTVAYNAKDWKYVDAAFQTVDRKFGFGIDTLAHHITDGHVVHHLFFTKIPHYNLPMATKALREHLEKNKLGWLYQLDKTYDFPIRIHKYLVQSGFKTHLAKFSPHRPQI